MKSIYNITRGQFLSIWFFGIIATLAFSNHYEQSNDFPGLFFGIFIPFLIIFYSFGRWDHLKK